MLKPMKKLFGNLVFAPIIIAQGKYVKRVTPKLPEAAGLRSGQVGQGDTLKLLIVGDSAAAGVGVTNQDQALSGFLVKTLSQSYQVDWRLLAKSGITTAQTKQMILAEPKEQFDVIVTSLGVNDVTQNLSASVWLTQQQELISLLRAQFNCSKILITKVPPMHQFPALPQPLRKYLGGKALQFNRHLAEWVATQDDCQIIEIDGSLEPEDMASDGFHPGPIVYRHWAETVANYITST